MKPRSLATAIAAIVLLATLFLVSWCVLGPIHNDQRASNQRKDFSDATMPDPATMAAQGSAQGGPYKGQHDVRWKAWHEKERADMSFQWKTPIRFYGIVVDERDLPVPAATIRFGWNDVSGSRERFGTSGGDGKFQLTGVNGKILTVKAAKDGFHSSGSKGGQAFEYSAFFEPIFHEPDEARPVVFRLVRKLEAERMVKESAFKKVSYDARWYYSLQNGTIADTPPQGPGLSFLCERSESSRAEPYSWKWRVEGVQLGILPVNVEFPQLAPEGIYSEVWEAAQLADAKPFRSDSRERFFLRTAAGTYGWVELEMAHPNDRALGPTIRVTSYLNPTGSRVIEVEPSKVSSRQ